jgi:replicative DNA helicase
MLLSNESLETELVIVLSHRPALLSEIGVDELVPDDFSNVVCKFAYKYIRDMFIADRKFDLLLLHDHLCGLKLLSTHPALSRQIEFFRTVKDNIAIGISESIEYAMRIKECSERRRIGKVYRDALEKVEKDDASTPQEIVRITTLLSDEIAERGSSECITVSERFTDYFNSLTERRTLPEGYLKGIPSGYLSLDNITKGIRRSNLIIIGGRAGQGKTAFATNMAINMAYPPARESYTNMPAYNVAYFTLEMSANEIMDRILCQLGRMTMDDITKKKMTDTENKKFMEVCETYCQLPISINDSTILTPSSMRRQLTNLAAKLDAKGSTLDAVFIDYLQLMKASEKHHSREQEVAEISASLKAIAKDLDIAVVALAQLRRPDRFIKGNDEPQLTDLRESGSLEQDADIVMLISRDLKKSVQTVSGTGSELEDAKLYVRKNRNGPSGTVRLKYLGSQVTFLSGDQIVGGRMFDFSAPEKNKL